MKKIFTIVVLLTTTMFASAQDDYTLTLSNVPVKYEGWKTAYLATSPSVFSDSDFETYLLPSLNSEDSWHSDYMNASSWSDYYSQMAEAYGEASITNSTASISVIEDDVTGDAGGITPHSFVVIFLKEGWKPGVSGTNEPGSKYEVFSSPVLSLEGTDFTFDMKSAQPIYKSILQGGPKVDPDPDTDDPSTSIAQIKSNPSLKAVKTIKNGRLVIIKGGREYTSSGQVVE